MTSPGDSMWMFLLRMRAMFGTPVPPSYFAISCVVMPNLRPMSAMVSPRTMVYGTARAADLCACGGGLLAGGLGAAALWARLRSSSALADAPLDTPAFLADLLLFPHPLHPMHVAGTGKRYKHPVAPVS